MYKNSNILKCGKYFAFLLALFLVIAQSCKEPIDEPEPPKPNPHKNVNDWILGEMEIYYLWNKEIPAKPDKTLKPDEFFKSLMHKDDRFSVIYENWAELSASLSGVSKEAGYEFRFVGMANSNDIFGYITYVKPKTPAQEAGLKRGDLFLRINNIQLDRDNYGTLMREMSKQHSLGLAKIVGNSISPTNSVTLDVIVYEENPILLDTIYHIQEKKIGYFVYNFFARDSETGGITYEKELNNLFGRFRDEAIDELIIDLRYNGGGTSITARALASMISGLSTTDIFGYDEYNSLLHEHWSRTEGAGYNISYFLDNINSATERVPINKLSGLNRVHLIVSGGTASASELVINVLRPYMGDGNVVLIGEKTYGKNVGSFLMYEEDSEKQKTNNWGMLPIVVRMSNKLHYSGYGNGFAPDIQLFEHYELEDMKQFGDIEEMLLSATLDKIFGNTPKRAQSFDRQCEIIAHSLDYKPERKNMYIDIHDRKDRLPRRD